MGSLAQGATFIKLAWKQGRSHPLLLAPTLYTFLVGLGLTILALGLISLATLQSGSGLTGPLLLGLLVVLLAFGLSATAAIFGLMTASLYAQTLSGDTADLASARNVLRRNAGDVLILSMAAPGLAISRWLAERTPLGSPPERAWQAADYLVIPTLAVEAVTLPVGLKRVTTLVREHHLRIGADIIGVAPITRLGGMILSLVGIILGAGITTVLAKAGPAGSGLQLAAALGLFISFLFILVAIALGTYASTLYHTCLYHWACQSEQAHRQNQPAGVPAPSLLAAVLSGTDET